MSCTSSHRLRSVVLVDDGVTANGGSDTSSPETFAINVTKPHRWHNTLDGLDVTLDGHVVPGDALAVINYLNAFGHGPVPRNAALGPPYYDTTGDDTVAPSDALAIINHINAFGAGEGEGSGFRVQKRLVT